MDIICPLIANLSHSLGKLSENTHDNYILIGANSHEFQKQDPNLKSYVTYLYEEVIFADTDFEMERDRLQKNQEKSFIDFYNSRKTQKDSPAPIQLKEFSSTNNNQSIISPSGKKSFSEFKGSHHNSSNRYNLANLSLAQQGGFAYNESTFESSL